MEITPIEMETKTDNEIIAEFMGLKLDRATSGGNRLWNMHGLPDFCNQIGISENRLRVFYASDLEFDKSWDWLMPVVVRCHELGDAEEQKFPEAKDLDDPTGWKAWSYRRVGLSTDINQVYTNVVNFIKWYNSQDTSSQPKKQ